MAPRSIARRVQLLFLNVWVPNIDKRKPWFIFEWRFVLTQKVWLIVDLLKQFKSFLSGLDGERLIWLCGLFLNDLSISLLIEHLGHNWVSSEEKRRIQEILRLRNFLLLFLNLRGRWSLGSLLEQLVQRLLRYTLLGSWRHHFLVTFIICRLILLLI